jgi:hypothetical protein
MKLNKHKSNSFYTAYILFVFFIKILFVLFAVIEKYYIIRHKEDTDFRKKMTFWKTRLEFIFVFLMALLCIYLFNPFINETVLIDNNTQVLLFVYGFIILITADWKTFFHESPWFINLQKLIA